VLWKFCMRDDAGCLVHDALHWPEIARLSAYV
jgi:hypothetical protein